MITCNLFKNLCIVRVSISFSLLFRKFPNGVNMVQRLSVIHDFMSRITYNENRKGNKKENEDWISTFHKTNGLYNLNNINRFPKHFENVCTIVSFTFSFFLQLNIIAIVGYYILCFFHGFSSMCWLYLKYFWVVCWTMKQMRKV